MNYLAHIQLAHISQTSKVGNFLGDFVKGSDLSHLPLALQQGITLHRKVDSYTDSHQQVVSLREVFPKQIRRMSGVVIDIYFDHLLCQQWSFFNDETIDSILFGFYSELKKTELPTNKRFNTIKESLLEYKWLANYVDPESSIRAFLQIEKRLNQRIKFAHQAQNFLDDNEEMFKEAFLRFYPELMRFSQTQKT